MSDAGKFQALPRNEVRERLLNKRQDAFLCAHRPPLSASASVGQPAPLQDASAPIAGPGAAEKPAKAPKKPKTVFVPRVCKYAKCRREFTPSRVDQVYHSADCRKRDWFESHFMPIPKPEGPS